MRYFRLPKVRFERLLAPKHTQHLSSDLTYSYTTSSTSRCLVTLHRLRSDCKLTLIAASMPIVCLSTGAGGNVVVTFHRFIHKILVASTTCGERVDTLISSRLIGMAITVSSRMLSVRLFSLCKCTLRKHRLLLSATMARTRRDLLKSHSDHCERCDQTVPTSTTKAAFGRELSETLGGTFVQGHSQNPRPASHRRRPLRLGRTTSIRMCPLRRLKCAMDKRRLPINERTGAHLQVRARHYLLRRDEEES